MSIDQAKDVTTDRNAYNYATQVRVRLSETDAVGIAFFGSFSGWMDVGRMDYLNHLGLAPKDAPVPGLIPGAVVHADVEFLSPARYNDKLIIHVRCAHIGTTSYTLHFLFRHMGAGGEVARGALTLTWLDDEFRPKPVSEEFRTAVASFEGY